MKTSAITLLIASIFLTTTYANNISESQLSILITENNSNPWILEDIQVGQIIELSELEFDMDQSVLNEKSKKHLLSLANFLNENKDVQIELRGHTNSMPPHDYCDKLSENRSLAVKEYLVSLGVNTNNITAKGYGKRIAKYSNSNSRSRKLNQRVEVKILSL